MPHSKALAMGQAFFFVIFRSAARGPAWSGWPASHRLRSAALACARARASRNPSPPTWCRGVRELWEPVQHGEEQSGVEVADGGAQAGVHQARHLVHVQQHRVDDDQRQHAGAGASPAPPSLIMYRPPHVERNHRTARPMWVRRAVGHGGCERQRSTDTVPPSGGGRGARPTSSEANFHLKLRDGKKTLKPRRTRFVSASPMRNCGRCYPRFRTVQAGDTIVP